MGDAASLADTIDRVLPQTQCTKCGFAGCRPYAEAIAQGAAGINQCPPGGAAGIAKLAALLHRPIVPLDPAFGVERPLLVALIDESRCIGCTLCIQACPVDAIVGAAKRMHTVVASLCTGCDLCLPPCPVDCIAMVDLDPPRVWQQADAEAARSRHQDRSARLRRLQGETEERLAGSSGAHGRSAAGSGPRGGRTDTAVVAAAIERARRRREGQNA
ncbi:MAG: electron transport complex subunit RsxB [Gemmatimonadota bacterium]